MAMKGNGSSFQMALVIYLSSVSQGHSSVGEGEVWQKALRELVKVGDFLSLSYRSNKTGLKIDVTVNVVRM